MSSFAMYVCTFVILPIDITPLQSDIKSLLVARLHRVEQQVVVFQTLALKQGNDGKTKKRKNSNNQNVFQQNGDNVAPPCHAQ